METVRKVNIGGFAFTLEEEAYLTVKAYLDALDIRYQETDNGKEIEEGIEARMAELLMDKVGKNGVVTPQIARWCIDILGRPEDIFDGEESEQTQVKKKLYRDRDDKKIGGVCSGLAAFFGIDPLWLRLGAATLWILFTVIADRFDLDGMFLLMPAIYIVLLICVPFADTNLQKYEMRGEKISLEEIERQVSEKKNTDRNGSNVLRLLCKIFLVTIGVFLLFTGVVALIALFASAVGIAVVGAGIMDLFDSFVSVSLGGSHTLVLIWKLSGILCLVLPFAGMIYGGILLIFKFKSPKWKPGLCGLVLWIVSLIVFSIISAVRLSEFFSPHRDVASRELVTSGKTLHIQFEDLDKWSDGHIIANGNDKQYKLVYYKNIDSLGRDFSFAVYPEIHLLSSDDGNLKVRTSTRVLNETRTKEELESSEVIEIDTDTLKLSPSVIQSGKRINDLGASVKIYVPDGMNVVVSEPVEHFFDKDFDCSDLDIDSRKVQEIISSIFR